MRSSSCCPAEKHCQPRCCCCVCCCSCDQSRMCFPERPSYGMCARGGMSAPMDSGRSFYGPLMHNFHNFEGGFPHQMYHPFQGHPFQGHPFRGHPFQVSPFNDGEMGGCGMGMFNSEKKMRVKALIQEAVREMKGIPSCESACEGMSPFNPRKELFKQTVKEALMEMDCEQSKKPCGFPVEMDCERSKKPCGFGLEARSTVPAPTDCPQFPCKRRGNACGPMWERKRAMIKELVAEAVQEAQLAKTETGAVAPECMVKSDGKESGCCEAAPKAAEEAGSPVEAHETAVKGDEVGA